jgi:hypothetical protein
MMDERRSILLPVAVAVFLTLFLLTVYTTAYFRRAFVTQMIDGYVKEYPTDFEAVIFVPAARIESCITDEYVRTSGRNQWDWEESWK